MKEVVVMLSLVTLGVLSAQSIPDVVEQLTSYHQDGEFIVYSNYQFLRPDQRITREEMLAYNRTLGIRVGEQVGLGLDSGHPMPEWNSMSMSDYSQPSSFISVTSNPSERRASPAIF